MSVISPYNPQFESGGTFISKRETMRAMSLIAHGGREALLYSADIPVPEPETSEVLMKVGAAGINNTDINTRVGWYFTGDGDAEDASWGGQAPSFPWIQGADICGEVIDIGTGADSELIGKRVLVETWLGESNGEPLVFP